MPNLSPVRTSADLLRVGGLTALSTTDYPGQLSAVVFCQGCPWRCGYCHNPHLLQAYGDAGGLRFDDIVGFLGRRVGLLDAVVFSGGEPLAQRAIAGAMHTVKALGFRIGLHTGGAYPERFAALLPLVDWVGFDVKTSFETYADITGVRGSGANAKRSAELLLASGVDHEFRTTVHPGQHAPEALAALARRLAVMGVRRYVLQQFRRDGCADASLCADRTPPFVTDAWHAAIAPAFESFEVRSA